MRRSEAMLCAIMLAAATRGLAAQSAMPESPKSTVISIQPLGAMVSVYALELEHSLSPTLTFGIGGTFWNPDFSGDKLSYTSGDLKLRYYPQEHPMEGFAFGMSGGYTHIKTRSTDFSGTGTKSTASGPTVGVSLDYNWLLGRHKGFYIGLGVGAKRIFASSEDVSSNVKFGYPTARVSVGAAF